MKLLVYLSWLNLYFCFVGCNYSPNLTRSSSDTSSKLKSYLQATEDVSIMKLIANPNQYNGHKVRVIGYLNLEFEGNEIYVHKEDYDENLYKNGLWVNIGLDSMRLPHIRKCIKKIVLLEGTFDANNLGHMSSCSGSIKSVTRIEVWNPVTGPPSPPTKLDSIRFPARKRKS